MKKRYIVDGKPMKPADLKRLHKYLLDMEAISVISDELLGWRRQCTFRCQKVTLRRFLARGGSKSQIDRPFAQGCESQAVGSACTKLGSKNGHQHGQRRCGAPALRVAPSLVPGRHAGSQ